MRFINTQRLRDYPRLMLAATWVGMGLNLLLRRGWLGGMGQIIGSDFVTLYASGILYRQDVQHLYDLEAQQVMQQSLIWPTVLPGLNPYISPPYVAGAYSILTSISLPAAFILWTIFTLLCVAATAYLCARFLTPDWLSEAGLRPLQLSIIILSTFPFIEGFLVGQNHGLTLLLVTAVTVATLRGHEYLAGALAALLIYKPQFVFGFLVLWFVWHRWRSLATFAGGAALWIGVTFLSKGYEPYGAYLAATHWIMRLPYVSGFPAYLMVTPYGVLTSVLPESALPVVRLTTNLLILVLTMGLFWWGHRTRGATVESQREVWGLALVYPLLASPYALSHDLLILVPVFLLLSARRQMAEKTLYLAVASYIGALLLPLLSYQTGISFLFVIPLGMLVLQLKQLLASPVAGEKARE